MLHFRFLNLFFQPDLVYFFQELCLVYLAMFRYIGSYLGKVESEAGWDLVRSRQTGELLDAPWGFLCYGQWTQDCPNQNFSRRHYRAAHLLSSSGQRQSCLKKCCFNQLAVSLWDAFSSSPRWKLAPVKLLHLKILFMVVKWYEYHMQ